MTQNPPAALQTRASFPFPGAVGVVKDAGFCIGCGACASLAGGSVTMRIDRFGLYQPVATEAVVAPARLAAMGRVCPFSNDARNEDELAAEAFAGRDLTPHPRLGSYLATYAGHVAEDDFRQRGSSGGMGSWLATSLLKAGLADAVVHVKESAGGGPLFGYAISRSVEEVRQGAKSRYYPITLEKVIAEVRARPGRYVFVGIPCFIKAVRLVAREEPQFGASVAFCIGLVCGHLKTSAFAESLAWQLGIPPAALTRFDFRHKLADSTADRYGVRAEGVVDGRKVERIGAMAKLFGRDWGWGLFKPRACDFCDDVVAETADVTIGDAWLPQYVRDMNGTNVIVVRDAQIDALLTAAAASGAVKLDVLDPEQVVKSQASGFNHRREGLAFRLALFDARRHWRPIKRVQAQPALLGTPFEHRHELRMAVAEQSHIAFLHAKEAGDLKRYGRELRPAINRYEDALRSPKQRLVAGAKRLLNRLRGRL